MKTGDADPRGLDLADVRRAFEAAAATYDPAAALQNEVRERLLERLDYVKLSPAVVLDLGSATGRACPALARRYPGATVLAVDLAENMLKCARRDFQGPGPLLPVCADASALPLKSGSIDLVFCNLLLPWLSEPTTLLAECRRVLSPGGLLNIAACGPDTLYEMREAWSQVDNAAHVNRFMDMHDLGDEMLRVGLDGPVLDVEYFTLTYRTVDGIVRDLRDTGCNNHMQGRPRGLGGRSRRRLLAEAYEAFRRDGRLPVTCEVIFGHAWGTPFSTGIASGENEARVPLSGIGRRQGRQA